jgi:2,4-dienoyl-CoA reductase (NADPH2)
VTAAERGHAVTLYEAEARIGGQFNLAKLIPGKEEYAETLRYYARRIEVLGVTLNLSSRVTADDLAAGGFDEIVVATGVHPRPLDIPGADRPNVVSYAEALTGAKPVGARVAIVGAGGIGFDVAEFLTGRGGLDAEAFRHEWGVDDAHESAGGLAPGEMAKPGHAVTLLQRKPTRLGRSLGLTTGWVLRTALPARGVDMIAGATYRVIDDAGLHVTVDGEDRVIEADTVVVCAGQEPASELHAALAALGVGARLIGGAEEAAELDAARAIAQGTEVAMAL